MAIFENILYEDDTGLKYSMRCTTETKNAQPVLITGVAGTDVKVKISKGSAEFGIRPRRVGLSRVVGTGAAAFVKRRNLPIVSPTAFGSAATQIGAEIEVGGTTWKIISRSAEDF